MIVANRMVPNPVTVGPKATVEEALNLMRDHAIRHLPVMDQGRLIGLVTDMELRSAWFPSLLSELTVGDVMATDPLTVTPQTSVYQAARLIYQHRLTGLPVVEEGELVGIVTLADMLKAFVELLGLLTESIRLDLYLRPGAESLEEVHHLLQKHGAQVISVALLPGEQGERGYSLRLTQFDLAPLLKDLAQAGHRVIT